MADSIVLRPNAAFLYKEYRPQIPAGDFEKTFTPATSRGLVKSTVDVLLSHPNSVIHSVHVSRSNKYSTVVVTLNGEFTGKLLSTQVVGDSLSATLEIDGKEITVIDVQTITKPKPEYAVHFTGSLGREEKRLITPSIQLQYVLDTISSTVQYSLALGAKDGDPFEIQQDLYVENRSGVNHTANLYYATTPFKRLTQEKSEEVVFAARSAPQATNRMGLKVKFLQAGKATLQETTLITTATEKLQNVEIHFEIFVSVRQRTVEARANPVIKLPLDKLKLVDGPLTLFNAKALYITSGHLVVGTKSARVRLGEVEYGVRVSNEVTLKEHDNMLRVTNKYVFFNSASKTVELQVDYETQLNFRQQTYLRENSKKLKFRLTPGRSKDTKTVDFIRLENK
jgi:hypothetical protein